MKVRYVFILLILFASTVRAYYIKDFHSDIDINRDGEVLVTEHIVVDFEQEFHHGIYRYIPVKYDIKKGIFKYHRWINLKVLSVTDDAGNPLKYKVSRQGRNKRIRIGDPHREVSGVQVYVIKYAVYGVINEFDSTFELWWEVTGHGWKVPIQKASATIHLPDETDMSGVEMECFTGEYGSTLSDCEYSKDDYSHTVEFFSGFLAPYQGLSVAVSMPKLATDGAPLFQLSWFRSMWWFITANFWTIIMWIIFIPLPFITAFLLYLRWRRHGRDPLRNQPIMVRYKPPDDVNPAELGTLLDEKADPSDISASIVDLAVRGYLKIVEHDSRKMLLFKKKDYALVLMKDYDNAPDLNEFERKLLDYLFRAGDDLKYTPASLGITGGKKLIFVSTLKKKFYQYLNNLKSLLYKSLVERGYFPANPETVRWAYLSAGIGFMVFGVFLGALFQSLLMFVSMLLTGAIFLAFAPFMPRKTKKGAAMVNYAKGLEEFIHRVEKDRIERLAREDPTIFDRILPYAMVLHCADEWVEKFEGIFDQPPDWYGGTGRVDFVGFAYGFGSAMSAINHSVASAPRGSGGSGSAAGGGSAFSGGGFSGGGFGGGGGGAW